MKKVRFEPYRLAPFKMGKLLAKTYEIIGVAAKRRKIFEF